MFTTLIPLLFAFKGSRFSLLHQILFFHFSVGFLLDVITFCIYFFYDENSYWLTPFYYANFFGVVSYFLFKSTNIVLLKRALPWIIAVGLVVLFLRVFWFIGLTKYDAQAWFGIQVYFICLHIIIMRKELFKLNITPFRNPFFLISAGFIIGCVFPLISGLLQYKLYETSPDYFQISLIILNLSFVVANLIIGRGIYLLRPTSSPKPSPPLRGLS